MSQEIQAGAAVTGGSCAGGQEQLCSPALGYDGADIDVRP